MAHIEDKSEHRVTKVSQEEFRELIHGIPPTWHKGEPKTRSSEEEKLYDTVLGVIEPIQRDAPRFYRHDIKIPWGEPEKREVNTDRGLFYQIMAHYPITEEGNELELIYIFRQFFCWGGGSSIDVEYYPLPYLKELFEDCQLTEGEFTIDKGNEHTLAHYRLCPSPGNNMNAPLAGFLNVNERSVFFAQHYANHTLEGRIARAIYESR